MLQILLAFLTKVPWKESVKGATFAGEKTKKKSLKNISERERDRFFATIVNVIRELIVFLSSSLKAKKRPWEKDFC